MNTHRRDVLDNHSRRAQLERGYRAAVECRANKKEAVLDDETMPKTSERQLMLAALKLVIPTFNPEGQSDAYLFGAFEASVLPLLEKHTGRTVGPAAGAAPTAGPKFTSATSTSMPTGVTAGDSRNVVRDAMEEGVRVALAEEGAAARQRAREAGDFERNAMIARLDAKGRQPKPSSDPPDAQAARVAMIVQHDKHSAQKGRN